MIGQACWDSKTWQILEVRLGPGVSHPPSAQASQSLRGNIELEGPTQGKGVTLCRAQIELHLHQGLWEPLQELLPPATDDDHGPWRKEDTVRAQRLSVGVQRVASCSPILLCRRRAEFAP